MDAAVRRRGRLAQCYEVITAIRGSTNRSVAIEMLSSLHKTNRVPCRHKMTITILSGENTMA